MEKKSDVKRHIRLKMYLLQNGEVCETRDFMAWREFMTGQNCVLKEDKFYNEVGEPVKIVTTFLGIDMSMFQLEACDPILFETFVVGGMHHNLSENYSSYQKALEGHELMKTIVRWHDGHRGNGVKGEKPF
jgi:hypothetical protein